MESKKRNMIIIVFITLLVGGPLFAVIAYFILKKYYNNETKTIVKNEEKIQKLRAARQGNSKINAVALKKEKSPKNDKWERRKDKEPWEWDE